MKKALLIYLTIFPLLAYCNEIDKLQTKADVVNFLIKKIDRSFKHVAVLINDTSKSEESFGANTFYKLDFDKNGLTDLVIDGAVRLVILDMGKNNYLTKNLDRGTFFSDKVSIIAIDSASSLPKIIIAHSKSLTIFQQEPTKILDTLVYRFGGLIENNIDTLLNFNFKNWFSKPPCVLGNAQFLN